ncbi:MAG: hypothetical protein SGPRY_007777 [Prymnesium sp.]
MALSLAAANLAFHAPLTVAPTRGMAQMAVENMEGIALESGGKLFDPLGLAAQGSDKTVAWYRHSELKHGRVAMAAFVGWLVASNGLHFPGMLSTSAGLSFEDLSKMAPLDQWSAIPLLGKLQILLAIGILEHNSEWKIKPHYMAGGTPGNIKGIPLWDPMGTTKSLSDETLKTKRLSELKNG